MSRHVEYIQSLDAASALCTALTSASALVVTFLDPYFWWADSATGSAVALFTLYKGIATMIGSRVRRVKGNSCQNYHFK